MQLYFHSSLTATSQLQDKSMNLDLRSTTEMEGIDH